MSSSLDEHIEVLILHALYASVLYKHGILDEEAELAMSYLRRHNELAHRIIRKSTSSTSTSGQSEEVSMRPTPRCSAVPCMPTAYTISQELGKEISTLQQHLPFELLESIHECGCPLLNSSQVCRAIASPPDSSSSHIRICTPRTSGSRSASRVRERSARDELQRTLSGEESPVYHAAV